MNSHELAHALLARRVNDIRFNVIVTEGDENLYETQVALRDSQDEQPYTIESKDIITYNSVADFIEIKLGSIYVKEGYTDEILE